MFARVVEKARHSCEPNDVISFAASTFQVACIMTRSSSAGCCWLACRLFHPYIALHTHDAPVVFGAQASADQNFSQKGPISGFGWCS